MKFDKLSFDYKILQKMLFIYNALHSGWKVQIKNEQYVFSKKHDNNPVYFGNNYLNQFIRENLIKNE